MTDSAALYNMAHLGCRELFIPEYVFIQHVYSLAS